MTLNLVASSFRQQWSQRQRQQQQQTLTNPTNTTTPSHSHLSYSLPPLFIPEILEPILSLLDQKTLLATRLVCTTWAAIARPCLSLESIWHDNHKNLDLKVCRVFFDRLSVADTLVVNFAPKYLTIASDFKMKATADKDADDSDILFGPIAPSFRQQLHQQQHGYPSPFRVKKLVLKDAYEFHTRLNAFLDIFSALTTLSLECLIRGPLRMDILLRSCPSLRSLSIEYSLSDLVLWGPIIRSAAFQENSSNPTTTAYVNQPLQSAPLSGYGLKTLAIRHGMSKQAILQAMLQTLPCLRSLEIRFLKPILYTPHMELFNRPVFFQSLGGSCPNLRFLHFSLSQRLLTVQDSISLCEALPSLTGLSFSSQDLESFRQPFETIGPGHPRMGILEFYVNHLTRLELLVYRQYQEESLVCHLHTFLTEATHLQHLIAPKVYYWTEFLECKPTPSVNSGTNSIQPMAIGQHGIQETAVMSSAAGQAWNRTSSSSSSSKLKIWGWACRNLETLHLGFKTRGGHDGTTTTSVSDNDNDMSATKDVLKERSRIMFGFIARNCPFLKDLQIRRSCLDLSLEGGFCLLVKLKELEKLTIWSQSKELRLLEKDLSWIGYYEDATVDGKGTAVKRVVQAEAVAVSAKSTVASKTLPPSTKNIVSTTTTTTAAAVAATNAGPTTTATISIATEATAGINARTLSPLNPRATTTFTHNNPITTVNNRSNKNPANNNPTITTTSNTDSNPGAISSSKGERTRRKIKSFLRRVSSDSSSSSQTSTSLAITQAAKFEPHCHNIPTNIKAVYKSDNDWFLTMIKTTSPQKALPSPSQPAPALEPPFANKGESVYPCWPHLRTITWAVNPEKLFKDDKAATVFSTLRPDINFKVQQYIE